MPPTAKGLGAGLGVQFTVAPDGNPVTAQFAAAATLGPALVHVIVPVTVEPAGGLVGKPLLVACMSACGTTLLVVETTLFAGFGSAVVEPAVPVMLTAPPPAGAT